MSPIKSLVFPGVILLAALLAGCGGGGSSSQSAQPTGGFALLVGDNGIAEFDRALFEISAVTLLGDNGQEPVFTGMRTIDFLALETVNELLAEVEVPTGNYHKIRLQVDRVTLVELDNSGATVREVDAKRLANGKVDVLVKGGFSVVEGGTVVVAIDVDLHNAIKVTSTGSGKYLFRPVIFAKVIEQLADSKLLRLAGEFERIEQAQDRFRVCDEELMSDSDQITDGAGCRSIVVTGATGLFSAGLDGLEVATLDNFNNGDPVVIYGKVDIDAANLTASGPLPVLAFNVARGVFKVLEGTAASAFNALDESFLYHIDAEQGIIASEDVPTMLAVSAGAGIFDEYGNTLDPSAIDTGVSLEVEGMLKLDPVVAIDAFIAIVEPAAADSVVVGTATAIDLATLTLIVEDAEGVEHCVQLHESTQVQQLTDMGEVIESTLLDLNALTVGPIEISGKLNEASTCLDAMTIILSD